jgi:hypothetical protein
MIVLPEFRDAIYFHEFMDELYFYVFRNLNAICICFLSSLLVPDFGFKNGVNIQVTPTVS